MPLPKIELPIFNITLPSDGKTVSARLMTVKEEKILLMARQSTERADIYGAIAQIVNNCLTTPIELNKFAFCDLQWCFMQIRIASVGNTTDVEYAVGEERFPFKIELDKLQMIDVDKVAVNSKIELSPGISLIVRCPPASLYKDADFFNMEDDKVFEKLIVACADRIYEGDKVTKCADYTNEDLLTFINSLPASVFDKVQKFFAEQPRFEHKLEITLKDGRKHTIVLRTLEDFFIYG